MKKNIDDYTEIVKRDFLAYNYHVHNEGCTGEKRYKLGAFNKDLCRRVQKFVETDTGHAHDVMLIMTPPVAMAPPVSLRFQLGISNL